MKNIFILLFSIASLSLSAQTNCQNNLSIAVSANYKNCLGSDMFYQVAVSNGNSGAGKVSVTASLPVGVQIIDAEMVVGSYDAQTGIWSDITFGGNYQTAQLIIRCRITKTSVGSFSASLQANNMSNCLTSDDQASYSSFESVSCDNDKDGILDFKDIDDDNDGLQDESEYSGFMTPSENMLQSFGLTIFNSNEASIKTDDYNDSINSQINFKGDPKRNVISNRDWLLVNKKSNGNSNIVWEQTITNVREKVAYLFVFYTSSALNSAKSSQSNPELNIFQDGASQLSGIVLTNEQSNANGLDIWVRHELQIVPDYGKTSVTISIYNDASNSEAFAMAAFSLVEMPYASLGGDPLEDTDNDGIANYLDENFCDLNKYGISKCMDLDADGIMNSFDLDSDNDGLTDLAELMAADEDGDGLVDVPNVDSNNNGLADAYDATAKGTALVLSDIDADGAANIHDLDSDNDGISDLVEQAGKDTNGDGMVDNNTDNNANGLMDIYDPSIAQNSLGALVAGAMGANGNVLVYKKGDADNDGILNAYDLDSDGDNMFDIMEVNTLDVDGDGRPDNGFVDADNNGWNDLFDVFAGGTQIVAADFDQDGRADFMDKDADNDGISDAQEALSGREQDTLIILGAAGYNQNQMISKASNYDKCDLADYTDTDTDNDGIPDWKEGLTSPIHWMEEIKKAVYKIVSNNPAFAIYNESDANQNNIADWIEITASGKPAFLDSKSNYFIDENENGLTDLFEIETGGYIPQSPDANSNGNIDYRDQQGFGGGASGNNFSMPLTLLSFGGTQSGSENYISWTTTNEMNITNYEVQQSFNGKEFATIGMAEAAGQGSEIAEYKLTAASQTSATVYYRLKINEKSAQSSYSTIIALTNEQTKPGLSKVWGTLNQFSYTLGQASDNAVLKFYNIEGKLVFSQTLSNQSGTISSNELGSGIYVYQLAANGESTTGSFIITR